MQYPSMGKNRQYRVTIPQLNGGVNYAVPPHLIEDNQLSDVKNMWYKDGRLQTRPAISEISSIGTIYNDVEYYSTVKAKNKICVVSIANARTVLVFSFFDLYGNHLGDVKYNYDGELPNNILVLENAWQSETHADVLFFFFADSQLHAIGVSSDGGTAKEKPYVPTLSTGCEPSKEKEYSFVKASLLEPVNLLTDSFKCDFLTNGEGIYYSLPKQEIPALQDGEEIVVTHICGEDNKTYTHTLTKANVIGTVYTESSEQGDGKLVLDRSTGIFHFTKSGTVYAQPIAMTQSNMQFVITRTSSSAAKKICDMSIATWFGGGSTGLTGGTRLFVSGNVEYPSLMHWSALNAPLYFPENNYAEAGDSTQAITAFGKQSELLVIFKERELYCSYYVQGSLPTAEQLQNQEVIDIEAAQALFPIYQLHPAVGCDCPDTIRLCNNRLVWFNSNMKVYGLFTTGQYSERNVRELSRPIEKKLLKLREDIAARITSNDSDTVRAHLMQAFATEHESNYLLHVGSDVFVMDYSSYGFTYFSSYSNDEKMAKAVAWYIWQIDGDAVPMFCSACEGYGKTLYVAKNENTYHALAWNDSEALDKGIAPIRSGLCTKLFDFGYPERLKRINPFYLQVSGTKNETIKLTYFRGNGKVLDDYAPTLTGDGLEEADPIRVTPNAIRVREFGIGLESKGRMEIGSLTLNYSMMGTVR